MKAVLTLTAALLVGCGGGSEPDSCPAPSSTFSAVYVTPACTAIGTAHHCTVDGVSGVCA